ncbi:TonB family protein [Winogradskyella jejuensis]|uniref:TonB family C-terminal domain-containing protein n=1 Tax=Winogradskyella jejuensis TaxID=1089305 RepID=A0A1M5P297_9FLAO|nr:TonB family protein [Winogradskyella jejuensis]SHG95313.1 TonB family C-terminal domain-containing protein [Winogradskyella jejuensis]
MQNIDKYKAGLITFLLTGIVVFSLFSFHLTKTPKLIAETIYEVEAKTEEEIQQEEEQIEDLKSPTTNKAFNEDEEFKKLMKNFKTVSSDDFEKTTKALEESNSEKEVETETNSSFEANKAYALKQKETESYKKLQDLLNKKQNGIAEHASGGSTLTYSLKDRRLLNYNTPRYLCERSGKIVVNIKVNGQGQVTEAYINGASNSGNECLTEHALEYAKSVRFNNSNRTDQLGSITFYFKGK